ncbi:hypothetical protein GJ744_011865 [Endocarpon pusillum]|uniref:Uncharacterized protein n=1 Tax=Endocarpon pusillum TaxID=364733 RepID=A0A8H7E1U1_9EURO|nr:hypothetical protein GJ744_011865 [Endocarpon pusillum]
MLSKTSSARWLTAFFTRNLRTEGRFYHAFQSDTSPPSLPSFLRIRKKPARVSPDPDLSTRQFGVKVLSFALDLHNETWPT